jgi:hypothetical protein
MFHRHQQPEEPFIATLLVALTCQCHNTKQENGQEPKKWVTNVQDMRVWAGVDGELSTVGLKVRGIAIGKK